MEADRVGVILLSLACLMMHRPPTPEATEAAIRAIGANPTGRA